MLRITNIENLIKKYGITIQDTDKMINKYYSIKNQVLFTNNGSDNKITSLLKFLQGYYNYLNDEYMCDKLTVKTDKIINLFNTLKTERYDLENLFYTGIACSYEDEEYTVLKTESKKLLMVKKEYIDIFKDCYFMVDKEKNTNLVQVISNYGMECQGLILGFEFINVDGKRTEIKDYINSLL